MMLLNTLSSFFFQTLVTLKHGFESAEYLIIHLYIVFKANAVFKEIKRCESFTIL